MALAPLNLSNLFKSIPTVTNRTLRNSNLNLSPPRMKTKCRQNSFACRATTIWNSLLNDCRTAHTFPASKVKLIAMLAYRKAERRQGANCPRASSSKGPHNTQCFKVWGGASESKPTIFPKLISSLYQFELSDFLPILIFS